MKNKQPIMAVVAGVVVLVGVFAWLFWGSIVPDAGGKKTVTPQISAKVTNTTMSRTENGKKIWEFTVGEAESPDGGNTINFKDIKGKVFLNNGDVMDVSAPQGSAQVKGNDFSLEGGVKAALAKGGTLVAEKISWQQKEDVLTATGKVKIVHDDTMAKGDQIITSSKLVQFKVKGHALVEKGGNYDED